MIDTVVVVILAIPLIIVVAMVAFIAIVPFACEFFGWCRKRRVRP